MWFYCVCCMSVICICFYFSWGMLWETSETAWTPLRMLLIFSENMLTFLRSLMYNYWGLVLYIIYIFKHSRIPARALPKKLNRDSTHVVIFFTGICLVQSSSQSLWSLLSMYLRILRMLQLWALRNCWPPMLLLWWEPFWLLPSLFISRSDWLNWHYCWTPV